MFLNAFIWVVVIAVSPAIAATPSPPASPPAPFEEKVFELGFTVAAVVWPIALVAVVALSVPVLRRYLAYLNSKQALKREENEAMARANWAYFDPVNTTETIATIVAASVAARLIKAGPRVEDFLGSRLDYEKLRSIVRRMSQSINNGEADSLEGKTVAWVHLRHAEDYYERQALENLGAHVHFCKNNEALLECLAGENKDRVIAIISNSEHWLTNEDQEEGAPTSGEAAEHLLGSVSALRKEDTIPRGLPVLIYSRKLAENPDRRAVLLGRGASICTDSPEEIIHQLFLAAKQQKRSSSDSTEVDFDPSK